MMGNLAEIMTDMTLVIKAFRSGVSKKYGEKVTDDFLRKCIKTGFMSDEELEKGAKR
jgi:hypothetical protein